MLLLINVRVAQPDSWSDRDLSVDTNSLAPVDKHRLELLVEEERLNAQVFPSWRRVFNEESSKSNESEWQDYHGEIHGMCILNYFEDLAGNPLTIQDALRIVTQDPEIRILPHGFRPHDLVLAESDNSPIPEDPLSYFMFTQAEVDAIALFLRDVKELKQSPLYATHPRIHSCGNSMRLETISVDLIRSFMTVFRRLYMTGEPGNFRDACKLYCSRFWNKHLIDWVAEERRLHDEFLSEPASKLRGMQPAYSFNNKRLIDVFLYTRFAHQPNATRANQLRRMRKEVGNDEWLEFMFLSTVKEAAMTYSNVSQYIAFEMDGYWKIGGIRPSVDTNPYCDDGYRGTQLTAEQLAEQRLMTQSEKLGNDLWREAGSSANKLPNFIEKVRQILSEK